MKPVNRISLPSTNAVDGSTPELDALLKKSDGWRIDNRSYNAHQKAEIHIGWGTHRCEPASVVWEDGGAIVIETTACMTSGEHVRVDKFSGNRTHSLWTVVIENRPGTREGDSERNIHIYWLQVTRSLSPSL